jgi:hypothetical protein
MSPVEPGVLSPVGFAVFSPDGWDTGLQCTSLVLLPHLPQEQSQMLQARGTVRMVWSQCLLTNLQRLLLERQHLSICVLCSARKALGGPGRDTLGRLQLRPSKRRPRRPAHWRATCDLLVRNEGAAYWPRRHSTDGLNLHQRPPARSPSSGQNSAGGRRHAASFPQQHVQVRCLPL